MSKFSYRLQKIIANILLLLDSDSRTTRVSRTRQALDFDEDNKEDMKHSSLRKRTHTDPVHLKSSSDVGHGKRRSAAEAVDKIAQSSKRLRGNNSHDGRKFVYPK